MRQNILHYKFRRKKDPAQKIEHILGLILGFEQKLEDFVEMSSNTYGEALLTDEKKYVLISRSALVYENVQNFVLQSAPNSFKELQKALTQFHLSSSTFEKENTTSTYSSKQGVRSEHCH